MEAADTGTGVVVRHATTADGRDGRVCVRAPVPVVGGAQGCVGGQAVRQLGDDRLPHVPPPLFEADYLPAGYAEIYVGQSRHWVVSWLWFLS